MTRIALLLVATLATACAANAAPPAAASTTTTTKDTTMHEFAILFRPTRAVSPEDLPKRNAAAREWALALRADGTLRNAAPLEDDGVVVTQGGVAPAPHDGAVGAVLVVHAKDLESVVGLVKGHPGLAYGTAIEVRPVKATPPAR